MGIVMGGIDLPDNPAPTAKLFQRQGVEEKKLEQGRCKVQEIRGLILNMIRLHIYHITEVYCPDSPFPVVTLISWLGEYFIISTVNI